ncbi:topoisomerase [Caldimonas thermodepolymerans]|uniref:Topoisomerase n=1 Tax=Caldimonas thermodepolymerans TaxID=215580 RepID=A0A2S5T900_9BURK|nr:topoisomerase [Caldimonas thermodepolymerans]
MVAQKLRFADKSFIVRGRLKEAGLFGQHLFRHGGKMVVVTEGEIDALSVAQALALKWPAVSIPNGAHGAVKAIKAQLEWLASYDSIILWFDNDKAGRDAVAAVAPLLPPGKVKIVTAPGDCKDANDVLTRVGVSEVQRLVWDAPTYRPDGIVMGEDIELSRLQTIEKGWQTPLPELNRMTGGIHEAELWLLTAGSGIGKSTTSREWLKKALEDGIPCGAVFLEESKETTAKALIALDQNTPLSRLRENPSILTPAQWEASYRKLIANGRYFAYDHFGSVESDNLIAKLEYMAVSCGVKLCFLDHISIAVSGLDMDEGERRAIDILMTRLRSLIERTRMSVIAVSHLRKVGGDAKSFEQGGQIDLDSLRGSGALKQLSDTVVAIERDQQAEDNEERDKSRVRLLKCRFTGMTGLADVLRYDRNTGRQVVLTAFPDSVDTPADKDDEDPPF